MEASMSTVGHYPEIRSLSHEECEAVLARHQVGRLAFTFRDRVDIQPVHFVYERDWVYLRTSEGSKLTTLMHHPWVAFEVDEVRGPFDWTSVVVHGTAYRVDARGPTPDPEAEAQAVAVLRRLAPQVFTPADPVPHRHILVRIAVKEVSGRSASPTWSHPAGRDTDSY